jgi:hypothetical protein
MEYPVLPANSKAFNILGTEYFSSLYDIVWSFDYAISGNANTEAGFTLFLTSLPATSVVTGGAGIDLGYSGLSAKRTGYTVDLGVSGAVIAVGFDTTGLFAASATNGGKFVRDGLNSSAVKRDSLTIRSGWPRYSFNAYNYHESISSLTTETFNIVEESVKYKTVRARLGDLGRTLYIDFRNTPEEDFIPLLTKDVFTLPTLSAAQALIPGISFASPVSSNNTNSTGVFYIKNVHIEGFLPVSATAIEVVPSKTITNILGISALAPTINTTGLIVPVPTSRPSTPLATPNGPPTVVFNTTSSNVNFGNSVTLFWTVTDAEFIEVRIPGSASIFPAIIPGVRTQSGQISVSPSVTTTYTIVATNALGTVTRNVVVSVVPVNSALYINAIRLRNATVTPIQETAIANFFLSGSSEGWLPYIKRLYLPIWGNREANRVDMITTIPGVWRGTGGEFNLGYTRQSGNLYFEYDDTDFNIGLTNTDQSIFALIYENTFQTSTTVIRRLVGSSDNFSIGALYNSSSINTAGRGAIRGLYNIPANITNTFRGIFVSSLSGGRTLLNLNRRGDFSNSSTVTTTTFPFVSANSLTNTKPTAFAVGSSIHPSVSLGAHGVGLGMSQSDWEKFITALRRLWTTCSSLSLP